uniref:Secreted protein n=1 Tax=Achlya hypogyna TaxID=1202772 RepID=A0A0A7CNC4_ACHHY|nr:secreted protein [Achlya hypogyna]
MKFASVVFAAIVAVAAASKPSCDNPTQTPEYPTEAPAPTSASPTMVPTAVPTLAPTSAPTSAPSPAPQPGNGVPILINLAVSSHVGVDCPGIQSRFPAAARGQHLRTVMRQGHELNYNGKSVTCIISFQATGVGLTTGAYVEIVPEAYKVLTGETYGGQLTGGTCTGVCNVART